MSYQFPFTTLCVEPSCGVEVGAETPAELSHRISNHRLLAHPHLPLRKAANALADARVRFANEYLRLRLANPDWTERRTEQATIAETNDEITRLEAELEIARRMSA